MKEDAKPPRIAGNQAEREWMRNWVIAKLDAMDEAALAASGFDETMKPLLSHFDDPNVRACFKALVDKQLRELRTSEFAIAQAWRGNMEPLRRLYPDLKPFLQRPNLDRGEHFEKASDLQLRIEQAREDVRRIREIWKAAYNGKCNRPEGQITAVEIAAKRWGISANALRKGIPKKKG